MNFATCRKSLVLHSAPTSEPVTLAQAKAHMRYDGTDEDTLIESLITAARQLVEKDTLRAIKAQTWKLYLDWFPDDEIRLERPPVTSVSSIYYLDTDGVSTLWGSSNYTADLYADPPRIVPAYGGTWPSGRADTNGVIVTFAAGYSTVPKTIEQAILMLVAHWFANREAVITGTIAKEIDLAYWSLIVPNKWGHFP